MSAAEVTWRGGFGEAFEEVRNWNLPPDIPDDTPAEQRESFRRVPSSTDTAVVPSAETLVVSDSRDVARLLLDQGATLIISTNADLRVGRFGDGSTNALSDLVVRGGTISFFSPVEIRELVEIRSGTLETTSTARIQAAVIVQRGGRVLAGASLVATERWQLSDGSTLRVPVDLPGLPRARFLGGLLLTGPMNTNQMTQVRLEGSFQVRGDILWRDTDVELVGDIRPDPGDPDEGEDREGGDDGGEGDGEEGRRAGRAVPDGRPPSLALRLGEGSEEGRSLEWRGGVLHLTAPPEPSESFPGGILREGLGARIFRADLDLENAGILTRGAESELTFTGTVRVAGTNLTRLDGPCLFREQGSLQSDHLFELDLAPGESGRGFEFGDRSRMEVAAPGLAGTLIRVSRLVLEDDMQVLAVPNPLAVFLVETNATVSRPLMAVRGGVGLFGFVHVRVGPGAHLEVGGDTNEPARPTAVNWSGEVDIAGGMEWLADTNGVGPVVLATDVWRILPGGRAAMAAGSRFQDQTGAALVNLGELRVGDPPVVPEGDPEPVTRLDFLVNDGGRFDLPARSVFAARQAEWRSGEVQVGEEVRIEVGSGAARTVEYPVPQPEGLDVVRIIEASGLFHIRRDVRLQLGREVRFHLNEGRLFPDVPGGLGVDQPLTLDHVRLGGAAEEEPRIVLGREVVGPALQITKTLAWFGGQFRGVSGQDHAVILPAGSATDIRSTPENPGDAASIRNCVVQNSGSVLLSTVHALDGSPGSLLNLASGRIAVRRASSVSGLINQGGVVQRLEGSSDLVRYLDLRQSGRFLVELGSVRFESNSRIEQPVAVEDTGSRIEFQGVTLANAGISGPARKVVRGLTVEGTVGLENVTIEAAPGDFHSLKTTAERPGTVQLGGAVDWKGGGVNLEEGGRLEILPSALVTLAAQNDDRFFTFWDAGTVENRGRVTYDAEASSKIRFGNRLLWRNLPGSLFEARGNGDVFVAQSAGTPGEFRNEGGTVQFRVPPGGSQNFQPAFRQESGTTLGPPDAAPPAANSPGRRNLPDPGQLVFAGPTAFAGGMTDFGTLAVRMEATTALVSGGRVLVGSDVRVGGRLRFEAALTFDGGSLELRGNAFARFGRITSLRNDSRLFLAESAVLEARPGFNLRENSVLSGSGTIQGGVFADGIIAPGSNETGDAGGRPGTLTIETDLTLGAPGRLVVDLSLARGGESDRVRVGNLARFNGTLDARVPLVPLPGDLRSDPISVVDYATHEGDFANFVFTPLGEGRSLARRHRGEDSDLVVELVADTSADLAVELEAPLTAASGTELTYRFTLRNFGPEAATGVQLEVVLPANATLLGSDPAGSVADQRLVVPVPNLPAASAAGVSLRLQAPGTNSSVAVSGSVRGIREDAVPGNNTASAVTAVLTNGAASLSRFEVNPGGKLQLEFESLPGVRYRLERSTDLQNWTPVQEFTGDGRDRVVEDLGGEGREPEFYRLLVGIPPS